MDEAADSHLQASLQPSTANSLHPARGEQDVDNTLFASTTGISDEAWLGFSALLALAGLVIIHKAVH